jgi:hypothetical protein
LSAGTPAVRKLKEASWPWRGLKLRQGEQPHDFIADVANAESSRSHPGLLGHHSISRTGLFWSAFILTRPLGATPGSLLARPSAHGGLNLDRISSILVIAIFIAGCILFTSQRAGHHFGERLQ